MPVDRVTGDSTLKTVALFSHHISASSDCRFIYYYILLSSVSSLSLTNKHRGFVGDSKDDSKKCCHLCGWRNRRHFIPSTRPVTNLSVVSVPGSRAAYLGSPLIPHIMSLPVPISVLRSPSSVLRPPSSESFRPSLIMFRGGLPRAACCCRQHSVGWY